MKITVRNALQAAATLVQRLSHFENLDQVVEIDWYEDGSGFSIYNARRFVYNHHMFEDIQTDNHINEDEILHFDYVDSDGNKTSRVGVVHEPHKPGRMGHIAGIYDLDKGEYRYFNKDRMTNIWWLKPLDR